MSPACTRSRVHEERRARQATGLFHVTGDPVREFMAHRETLRFPALRSSNRGIGAFLVARPADRDPAVVHVADFKGTRLTGAEPQIAKGQKDPALVFGDLLQDCILLGEREHSREVFGHLRPRELRQLPDPATAFEPAHEASEVSEGVALGLGREPART